MNPFPVLTAEQLAAAGFDPIGAALLHTSWNTHPTAPRGPHRFGYERAVFTIESPEHATGRDNLLAGTISLAAAPLWLVWSIEHKSWWGPDENGYVTKVEDAGRYPFERAFAIAKRSETPGDNPAAMIQPAPEWVGLRQEIVAALNAPATAPPEQPVATTPTETPAPAMPPAEAEQPGD